MVEHGIAQHFCFSTISSPVVVDLGLVPMASSGRTVSEHLGPRDLKVKGCLL